MSVTPGVIGSLLLSIFSKNTRKDYLDAKLHFVPIDVDILSISLEKILIQSEELVFQEIEQFRELGKEAYNTEEGRQLVKSRYITLSELNTQLQSYLEQTHKFKLELLNSGDIRLRGTSNLLTITEIQNYTPAALYSNNKIIGGLYPDYNSAQKNLFTKFLNDKISQYIKESLYSGTKTKRGFDVGHLFGTAFAKTPLQIKIERLLDGLNAKVASEPRLQLIKNQVDSFYTNLKSRSTYGTKVEAELVKNSGVGNFLGKLNAIGVGINVVVIQDRAENQREYADKLETPTWFNIDKLLRTINFSRSFNEEIEFRIREGFTGKKEPGKSTSKKIPTINPNLKIAGKLTTSNLSVKPKSPTRPQYAQTNLVSLEGLINAQLTERIKQNMGSGSRKDILNLRTGRFAESVKLERLSESRQGMITAFYSYMRNPYQTFEPGFRQGSPASRNPKILITKSIKEIAAQQVANRMRAVLV